MGEGTGRFLPYRWIVPEDLPLYYASTFFVQSTGREFILRMFEVKPPLIVEDDTPGTVASPSSVDARCIGQFVLSPARARELLDLLQKYVEPGTGTPADKDGVP